MGLDHLKAVLPPPLNPAEVLGADAWEGAESGLGTRLPADFKAFVNTYGTGRIDGFLVVFNPFSSNRFVNLIERSQSDLEGMTTLKLGFPESYSFDVFPSPGGLLPCAATDNGNILYWRTVGLPEQWPIVVYESRGPSYCIFQGPVTEFLTAVLTRAFVCHVFPRGFPSRSVVFKSYESL